MHAGSSVTERLGHGLASSGGGNNHEAGQFDSPPAYHRPFLFWAQSLGRPECPYMRRWGIDLRIISIRVHHWISSDDDRAFHDHGWAFLTLILRGRYVDASPAGLQLMKPGMIAYRPALHRHTVVVYPQGAWTLVLTGPVIRKWGFWVGDKFVKSNKYFLKHGHHPCA